VARVSLLAFPGLLSEYHNGALASSHVSAKASNAAAAPAGSVAAAISPPGTTMTHRRLLIALAALASLAFGALACGATGGDGRERFLATYKELVETNTTLSAGDCTLAASRMAARLTAAGYPEADVRVFVPEGHPREGGLLAVLHGTDPHAKAILMLAHMDVVEAGREDWVRDPFTLIEEGGYFYGRGTSDMKAQAAVWVDNLVRFREEGFRPRRAIKLALTCGEETNGALNGAGWLAEHERAAIDAQFAITEGVDGELDAQGHRIALEVLAAEKVSQNYLFEVTNPGGHSSRPVPDNAIYHLVRAVDRVSHYEFPVRLNDANRAYFSGMSRIVGGQNGAAMAAVVANPADAAAVAVLDQDQNWHAMLRTTCVATTLAAGHATNALPQRARANINCRIFPGVAREEVLAQLVKVADDPAVTVSVPEVRGPVATPAPLSAATMGPVATVARQMWPGVPVVPALEPGASDAQFLNPAGIPTYGITGMFTDPDGGGIHGLNERIRVQSVYEGRTFLYRLVKIYANQ
jgi:acetylornithine deacetylase/succinyl-diaminopimelate desuccinylase-like protein